MNPCRLTSDVLSKYIEVMSSGTGYDKFYFLNQQKAKATKPQQASNCQVYESFHTPPPNLQCSDVSATNFQNMKTGTQGIQKRQVAPQAGGQAADCNT